MYPSNDKGAYFCLVESRNLRVALMFGGNVGDTVTRFREAATRINESIGKILRYSSIYTSEPWGNANQPPFLNQAVIVETILTPQAVLAQITEIENALGRQRIAVNGPREIDIDILLIENGEINLQHLVIPHPRMHLRNFNLVPLNEIAPLWRHPVLNKTVQELMAVCVDSLYVEKTALSWQ